MCRGIFGRQRGNEKKYAVESYRMLIAACDVDAP